MNRIQRRLRQTVSILVIAAAMLGATAPQAANADSSLATARLERTAYLTAYPNGTGQPVVMQRILYLDGGNYHWHFGLAVTDGSQPFYVERSEVGRDLYLRPAWYFWECTLYQGFIPVGTYHAICDLDNEISPYSEIVSASFFLPHSADFKMASYLDPF